MCVISGSLVLKCVKMLVNLGSMKRLMMISVMFIVKIIIIG